MTPAEIDAEFKRRFHAGEPEAEISAWYKEQHQILIDERVAEERKAAREANNERKCEVCLTPLPIKKGKAPKRCEDHK